MRFVTVIHLRHRSCVSLSTQVGGRFAISMTVYTMREASRILQRRTSDLFLRWTFSKQQATSDGKNAFSKVPSYRDGVISGKDSNADTAFAVSLSSTTAVDAATDCQDIRRNSPAAVDYYFKNTVTHGVDVVSCRVEPRHGVGTLIKLRCYWHECVGSSVSCDISSRASAWLGGGLISTSIGLSK